MLNKPGFRFINKYSLAAWQRAVDFSADNHVDNNVRTANACIAA